ncbi:MAG: hypothetical protein LBR81_02225 [Prevotellaceae bacterium]|jgi:hypothetical protein|nr:hypothetical protein [Prevotellaceae bacterium]
MENELISNKMEDKIIANLQELIDSKKPGKIMLSTYLTAEKFGTCMDFAEVYEASDSLRFFIEEQRRKGVVITIQENSISVG